MKIVSYIILFIIAIIIIKTTKEPPVVKDVKERYEILKKHIKNNKVPGYFDDLDNDVDLTFFTKKYDQIGYNVNKGQEIGLCVDGEANEIFHVLIHELAHSSVPEYNHSKLYWQRFKELKKMCVELGIYERIPTKQEFCGKYIKD